MLRMAKGRLVTAATIGQLLVVGACQSGQVEKIGAVQSPERLEYVSQFKKIDAVGKGQISMDQATAHYSTLFGQLDKNRDGFLDANELQPLIPFMGAKSTGELLTKLDRNSDNKVSQPEFLVIANWLFQLAGGANVMTLAEAQNNVPPSNRVAKPPTLFGN
jgi:hypothetical protein